MLQRHPLSVRERDALFERLAGDLLQQLHLAVLVGQIKVLAQHLAQDKHPVEMIGTRDGAARHQHVALPRDGRRLWQVVLLAVGLEGARIGIEVHLRVGTQIDRPLQRRLQIFDVKSELILVGSARRFVQVFMKLPHLVFLRRHFLPFEPLSSTHNLHTHARCPQESHHRLVHPRCLIPNGHSVFVSLQSVHLDHRQSVVL